MKENKESSQVGWISKVSIACILCESCQQLRLIFSSRTHRISIRLHTHGRPQYPIVFIHNISLYFKCISSMKYVFKWSCHGHIMPFSTVQPKWFNVSTQKKGTLSLEGGKSGLWGRFRMIIFVSISYVISLSNYFEILPNSFETSLRQNLL